MASKKWSFQPTTTRTGLSSSFSYHRQSNFRPASNHFRTIASLGTSDNFFKIKNNRWNNSSSPVSALLLRQQQCMSNSSSSLETAAAAYNQVFPPDSSSSSSPSSSLLPFLMLPSEDVEAGGDREEVHYRAFLSLRDNKVTKLQKELPEQILDALCKRSSRGWLAYVSRRDCGIYLADLFPSSAISPPKIVPLPSILTLPEYKAEAKKIESHPRHHSLFLLRNLAMSSSPTLDDDTVDLNRDCVVMMFPHYGHLLAFCRIGDPTWMQLPGSAESPPEDNMAVAGVHDVMYSRKDKLFYSVTSDCQVQAWDFNNAGDDGFPKRIDFGIEFSDMVYPDFYLDEHDDNLFSTKYYLVESPEGEILYLEKCCVCIGKDESKKSFPYRSLLFSAYKLDFEKRIGIPIKSLGDTALFLGLNESFSLSTRDHPELTPNSIYFTDDLSMNYIGGYGGDDMGVYNFEDYSVAPLFHLYHPSEFKHTRPAPIWVSRT